MNLESLHTRFTETYEAQADAIFRFCLVRVSDREQALDIAQEAFVRLWQTLANGGEVQNDKAFLFTVAHRLVIDWYRKKKSSSLETLMEAKGKAGEPAEVGEGKDKDDLESEAEGRYLLEKISQLHDASRTAVYLRFVEGLSPPQIGEILGISANTASVRINRGLKELRKMAGYGDANQHHEE